MGAVCMPPAGGGMSGGVSSGGELSRGELSDCSSTRSAMAKGGGSMRGRGGRGDEAEEADDAVAPLP